MEVQLDCESDRVWSKFQSGQWSDCKFLIGTEPNQAVIEAHKMILAMTSPVFEAMFYGEMAERNSPIPIPDIEPVTFKAMLKHIYVDKIEANSFDEALKLYYASRKYILPELQKKCVKHILDSLLRVDNVCRAYEFASLFDEKLLTEECLKLMTNSTFDIINDSSFEDAHVSTVVAIFSLDRINCFESDLFYALERFLKAQVERLERSQPKDTAQVEDVESAENRPETTQDEGTTPAQPETIEIPNIRPALEKIRFLTFTAKEFAEGPAKSSLLTEHEVLAILMNLTTTISHVPMPIEFSISRQRRSY